MLEYHPDTDLDAWTHIADWKLNPEWEKLGPENNIFSEVLAWEDSEWFDQWLRLARHEN